MINRVVKDIKEALLTCLEISVHPVEGSKNLHSILFAVVDPDAELELKVRDVADVMEACFVDSLSSISFCENVCVFVYTSEELAFSMQLFVYGCKMFCRYLCCPPTSGLCFKFREVFLLSVRSRQFSSGRCPRYYLLHLHHRKKQNVL